MKSSTIRIGKRVLSISRRVMVLPLARKLNLDGISASQIRSRKKFIAIINDLGKNDDTPLEMYLDDVRDDFKVIRNCVKTKAHTSAVVLLFTIFEAEVNTLIRIALRVNGYSNGAIDGLLKGADFNSKIDVLAPLIGAEISQVFREAAMECKRVRNSIVHNKAYPARYTDKGDHLSDRELNENAAVAFFKKFRLSTLEKELGQFMNLNVSNLPAVQEAWRLLDRYTA